ncbi:AAA family ATPase [Salinigranum halophilum]|uniref:AAA family ATPase n=1 Tax=Salinigranum halophilum TaxID=2565931 RepID=UPI0010A86CC2|nr:MoxR family ATPase [Salinigranum halophilum]
MSTPAELYDRVHSEIGTVLIGNDEIIEGLFISLLTEGHILLEGVPGIAKTTIAKLFAGATGLDYSRIQMTPDILPADITGTEVYRKQTGDFELQRGPVFANLVLVDEINRATAKTQSALLESMQERQVTIGRETLALPEPFMVVATQNPIEMEGVYELPEAQRDRFQFRYSMGLPDKTNERRIIDRFDSQPDLGPGEIEQVVTPTEIAAAQETALQVHVSDAVKDYLIDVIDATRSSDDVAHGASTRASLMLLRGAKARAIIHDRNYVIPDDIMALVEPALAHRLVLNTDADLRGRSTEEVLAEVLSSVELPEDALIERNAPSESTSGSA